ncbi:MAG: germination protein YpeB [Oscillospiraceae bacterium]|nr:germination protein YpeB [Oscillospiraceae bacterium]
MYIRLKKRGIVRICSFAAAAVMVLAGLVVKCEKKIAAYDLEVENYKMGALLELTDNINNMETVFKKSVYAESPVQFMKLAAELWKYTELAKASLNNLPVLSKKLENTHKFLSQSGDYAMSLASKALYGEKMTEEERENFELLSKKADTMQKYITSLEREVSGINALSGSYWKNFDKLDNSGFDDMENEMISDAALVYSGRFSDNIDKGISELAEKSDKMGEDVMIMIASEIMGADKFTVTEENSKIPCKIFSDGKGKILSLTQNGGYLYYYINSRKIGEESVSREEATEKACRYLDDLGYDSMGVVCSETTDGILTLSFVWSDDGVLCYSDSIKVSVALDNGEIIAVNAGDYIMNHKTREIPENNMSTLSAMALLSPELSVRSFRSAFISKYGEEDIYVYEFFCDGKENDKVIVYINPQNGEEEEILLFAEEENGTFVR